MLAQIGVSRGSPSFPSHPVVASAYERAAIACASSAAIGQDGGTSAMPFRYSSKGIVTVSESLPSATGARSRSVPG
ncbi:MAG: hypothetical protein KatS3mg014_0698 [Actinomycetota bacterium]|nr:MAG: hypothetical protein KatS3mg014_0698 [Actinomycetota bacterium]